MFRFRLTSQVFKIRSAVAVWTSGGSGRFDVFRLSALLSLGHRGGSWIVSEPYAMKLERLFTV